MKLCIKLKLQQNNMNYLLTLIGLLLSINLIAQPGYQGKKLFIEGAFSGSIATMNPTANNRGYGELYDYPSSSNETESSFGINSRWGVKLSYVTGYSSNVTFTFHQFNTGVISKFETTYPGPLPFVTNDPVRNNHSIFYKTRVNMFGIQYQKYFDYSAGNLAPLGWYYSIGANLITGNSEEEDYHIRYPSYIDITGQRYTLIAGGPSDHKTSFTSVAFQLGLGRRYIFADRFILNMSVETYLLPAHLRFYFAEVTNSQLPEPREVYSKNINRRLQLHLSGNIKVGLGIILF